MTKENLSFEIGLYERILRRNPGYIAVMKALAESYTRAREYRKGLRLDLKLSMLLPREPEVHYNLACSYALVGEKKKAIETLRKAVILGYRDYAYMEQDPDLESLRDDEEFKEIVRICRLAH